VLETALAQLRFAASMVFGIPFSPASLERLADAARDTQREFGRLGEEAAEPFRGPALDEETRREMQLRRFRAQALRGARETVYYREPFERLGLDPARLSHEDIARLPLTPKEALRERPDDFVRRTSRPTFRTTTTGTTGKPTSVFFSSREMRNFAALNALGFLLHDQIHSEDTVQISTSSRATLGNTCFAAACERIGALWYQTGLVEPEVALALLAEKHRLPGKKERASFLNVYPSYLGKLVECGLRLGYRPVDFGLERISIGGEIVTEGLKERCQRLFGPVAFVEGYAMTETWPFGAARCEAGHLHFEASRGLLEALSLETLAPARPGEAGALVVTPFAPYRETTVVLRYSTEDVARALAGPLTCSLRGLPATSDLLGKWRLSVRHDHGWTFPRDVLEALEAVEAVPLPARCGFWAVPHGVALEVVVRQETPTVRRKLESSLEARGVPLQELRLVEHPSLLQRPFPLRCDLKESSFGPMRTDSLPQAVRGG
jgi:phenylacetate-CoA ligase